VDLGTGYVQIAFSEASQETFFVVHSDNNEDTILKSKIFQEDIYQRQQGKQPGQIASINQRKEKKKKQKTKKKKEKKKKVNSPHQPRPLFYSLPIRYTDCVAGARHVS
jgi:hypothetical protein